MCLCPSVCLSVMGACCSKNDAVDPSAKEFTDLSAVDNKKAKSEATAAESKKPKTGPASAPSSQKDGASGAEKAVTSEVKDGNPSFLGQAAASSSSGSSSKKPNSEAFESDYAPESAVGGNPLFSNPNIPSSFSGVAKQLEEPTAVRSTTPPPPSPPVADAVEDPVVAPPPAPVVESPPKKKELKGSKMKLIYFPIQGHAECVRLTLALAGADYESQVLDPATWNASTAEYPLESLPVLEVPHAQRVLCGAGEILPFLAEITKVLPESGDMTSAMDIVSACHALREAVVDLRQSIVEEAGDSQIAQLADEVKNGVGPRVLSLLEQQLPKHAGAFLFSEPSVVDAVAFDVVNQLSKISKEVLTMDVASEYPAVWTFVKEFSSLDSISQYLNSPRRFAF